MADSPDTTEWMKELIGDLLDSGKVANAQLQDLSKTLAVINVEIGAMKRETVEFQETTRKALALEARLNYVEKEVEQLASYAKEVKSARFQFWGTVISAAIALIAAVAVVLLR